MRILPGIILLMAMLNGAAQTRFAYSHISVEDRRGLNSDVVYTTYQDEKGFLWVGTANGLQRFDGSKFISFGSSNPSSVQLPVSGLSVILPLGRSALMLYFGGKKEVGVYNTSTNQYHIIPFRNKKPFPARANMRLWKDKQGDFYFSVYRYGILKYDTASGSFLDYDGFKIPAGWHPDIFFFEDTLTNRIWFPCPDSGLLMYDYRTRRTYTSRNNPIAHPILKLRDISPGVSEIFIDSKRRYWIFSWTTVHTRRCYREDGTPLGDTAGLSQNAGYTELRHFTETRKGALWAYGVNALFNYDAQQGRFQFIRGNSMLQDDIRYNTVNHIMEDADGSIWIATDQGLYYTSASSGTWNVVNMTFLKKDINYEITDLLQLKSGQYWLTAWGGGVITLTPGFAQYNAGIYRTLQKTGNWQFYDQTWCMYQDSTGLVWIGCQAGRYIVHNPNTGETAFKELAPAENATLRYITASPSGDLFIGTQRGQLIRYRNKVFEMVQKLPTIIRKILVDSDGLLWVATEGAGLYCLSADGTRILAHFSKDTKEHPLYLNDAFDLEQLDDSTILCAAGALHFIHRKTGKTTWLTVEDGLPGNTLMRMRKDSYGYIWMITRNGLSRYNPANKRITPYGRKDGIMLAHITTEADFLCSDDYVMFAGGAGLMFFKSSSFMKNKRPPDVTITDFNVSGEYLIVDSLLHLPYIKLRDNQNSFAVNFSSLSFLQADKLTYYYRMRGISDTWTNLGSGSSVNFTLLPPGKYDFEVYSETIDGLRSPEITRLRIHILPPFWRTGWFITAMLTLVAMVAYGMHRLRIVRLLAVEKIRNRVARDLHDDMGSTLSTINILSSMAKAKLNTDPVKTGEYINKISDNSQRMMEAMDDIVWAIKPDNDNMHKVVGRMREFATNVFEAKDIDLVFKADDAVFDVQFDMEARRDFFLIFKEAVNNAAKYAYCSSAEVLLYVRNKSLHLSVRDNGKGFDVETADSGNGLGNMKKRADALKARIQIESQPGTGTTVSLSVPINF